MLCSDFAYLRLYACCIPIVGYRRANIVDLQRNEAFFVPNDIIYILDKFKRSTYMEICNHLDKEDIETLNDYNVFLLENELAFKLTSAELKFFPNLDLQWDLPYSITNAIIEINNYEKIVLQNYLKQLSDLKCNAVALFIYQELKMNDLYEISDIFKSTSVLYYYLYLNHSQNFNDYEIVEFANQNLRISSLNFYSTNRNFKKLKTISKISGKSSKLSFFDCSSLFGNNFTINIPFFTESQLHNTCLNRKICIDSDGYIKNCPSMKHHYGHISDTTLAKAIEKPGFKDCWFIKKDDIDVCQDCEFRHICTDCRAFIKYPNNIYSQPAKCGYNPYIAKWQREDGWISVEQWRTENPGWEEQAIELRELQKKFVDSNNE